MLPELLSDLLRSEELHPFAHDMLHVHGDGRAGAHSGFFEAVTIDGEPRLDWEAFSYDVELYGQLCAKLLEVFVREPLLTEFSPYQLAQLQIVMAEQAHGYTKAHPTDHTPAQSLFAALKSDDIQTSPRHSGTAVFRHVFLVLKELRFEAIDSAQDKLALAIAALYHDAGKAMAVGYGTVAQIRTAMDKYGEDGRLSDSYRSHEVVSARALLSLHRALLARIGAQPGREIPDYVLTDEKLFDSLFLIRFHHLCQEIYENRAIKQPFFMDLLETTPHGLKLLAWFRTLSFADLLSVAHQSNAAWSGAIVEMCAQMSAELELVTGAGQTSQSKLLGE